MDARNLIPFIPLLIFVAFLLAGFAYVHFCDLREGATRQ